MRGKKIKSPAERLFQQEFLAAKERLEKEHAIRLARLARTFRERGERAENALKKFRPKKSERGKIIFIGVKGGRGAAEQGRKGYGVYVSRNGKKSIVRQLVKGVLEKHPPARRESLLDVARVRNKKAVARFTAAHLVERARGVISALPASKKLDKAEDYSISRDGTIYAGSAKGDEFYQKADAVKTLAKKLAHALRSQRSKRVFLVTIGLVVKTRDGQLRFVSAQRRINRQDGQKIYVEEIQAFLGREIYGYLARELTMAGLVLAGSAGHIGRLAHNRGLPRDEWEKDGFLWEGHDSQNAKIIRIDYRFDQMTFNR